MACIDAINHLKILRLPHCIKIRGDGLFPLRGSVVLQNVDLSIVPIEIDQTPMLSIDAVLPTLESILDMDQNVLKNVHVPKVWRDSYNEKLNNFYFERELLPNFNLGSGTEHLSLSEKRKRYLMEYPNPWDSMRRFKMDCHKCSRRFNFNSYQSGLNLTCESETCSEACPECGKKYCNTKPNTKDRYSDCAEDEIRTCEICEKKKCNACVEFWYCYCCDKVICEDCSGSIECSNYCYASDEKRNCMDCAANDSNARTKECGQCKEAYCSECEPEMTHLGDNVCEICRNGN